MKSSLKSFMLLLPLVPCTIAFPQEPRRVFESPDAAFSRPATTEPITETLRGSTASPPIHLIELKHAHLTDVAIGLEKLFDSYVKSGDLVIVGDTRANRLVIRANDQIFVEVRNLVEQLDVAGPAPPSIELSQPSSSNAFPTVEEGVEWRQQIIQAIKNSANDPIKSKSLRDQLIDAVQGDFSKQQQQLQSELDQLRKKIDSLQTLLEKREAQRNAICLKRMEAILSGQAAGWQSAGEPQDVNPLLLPDSKQANKPSQRAMPLKTNVQKIAAATFPDEITTLMQVELSGEEGLQVTVDGKTIPLNGSMPFLLSNRTTQVQFDISTSDGKHAIVSVQLECENASDDFWKRIALERIRLPMTRDDIVSVAGNRMIKKCVYLSKEPGKGLAWLEWGQVDAGVDIREKSRQLGDLVLTMTMTRPALHSYGVTDQVQAYFVDLANLVSLIHTAGPLDSSTRQALTNLVANKASDSELRAAAKPRKEELDKQIVALKALTSGDAQVPEELQSLAEAVAILKEKGRQELEKWLSNDRADSSLHQKGSLPKP